MATSARKAEALAGEGEGSGGKGEPEDGNSQQGDSGGEVVSCNEAEESGSESSSSSLESEVEAKKARPNRKTAEANPNTSQSISLPELDSKDSKEECKSNCRSFAHCMDVGAWRDKKISVGLKQWDEWDKMTCDHVEPCKEAKCPDPLGTPLDYMESCEVFKPIKTTKYDLCRFYQVGLSGNFPEFPTPSEPATNNYMCSFSEKARELFQPNLIVAHSQDTVTAVCLLWELNANASLRCLKMETGAEAPTHSL